ncbi:MAG: CvpA family protein [Planctomycetaceae bacterium]
MAIEGYDLVMLGILAVTAVLGYFRGIVWQVAWIAGIVASGFVACRFAPAAAPFLGQQAPWNRLLAMLVLYAGSSLVIWLLFRVVSGAINAVHLSAFDHQLGLLLGLAKGALLCIVITFFAVTLAPAYRNQIVASQSGRIVAEIIIRADELLPKDVAESVDPYVKQFEERLRTGRAGPAVPGQPSAFQAIWDGVTSATAWTGAEQGGATVQAGLTPPAAPWNTAQPAGWNSQPAARTASIAPPARPAASGFTAPPAAPQPVPQPPAFQPPAPTPGGFPVGAQSPLPRR